MGKDFPFLVNKIHSRARLISNWALTMEHREANRKYFLCLIYTAVLEFQRVPKAQLCSLSHRIVGNS